MRLVGPVDQVGVAVGLRRVRRGDVLGQVLAEVAHPPVGVGGAAEQAAHVELRSEAHDVGRLGRRVGLESEVDVVHGLGPGLERTARVGADVALKVVIAHRHRAGVDGVLVRGPPELDDTAAPASKRALESLGDSGL